MEQLVSTVQFVAITGQLRAAYPPIYLTFTTFFAWSTGLFLMPSTDKIFDSNFTVDNASFTQLDEIIGYEKYLSICGMHFSTILQNTLFNFTLFFSIGVFFMFVYNYSGGNFSLFSLFSIEN
jgi:hypothetical protein